MNFRWAIQFGSIALAEAYFLQRRTTYAIRQQSREKDLMDPDGSFEARAVARASVSVKPCLSTL